MQILNKSGNSKHGLTLEKSSLFFLKPFCSLKRYTSNLNQLESELVHLSNLRDRPFMIVIMFVKTPTI